ncbi:protein DA1-related 1-like [Punica granatum]|uniref:Protein DA1-related 1-like n=2 Tax=Punica granatum TaxID=22663 RepID=A0A6P8CUC5_PUNGR|nr:protein DA1-related 1-like [Punica granatum]XP_031385703.1 protein DA1-related 1-like [Punica granatum]XP_031385704.1 protein DA1-related 1-like [Punica granatum]XP_031385706.1 protein DA1-related 1-like [Punica granatum]XP_031385707.1 protein DA1-related 1-like [Punica granatum]XP_031385708.1 protein DA1-related 1-like [Punica granatum]
MDWSDIFEGLNQSSQYKGNLRGNRFPNQRHDSMDELTADEKEEIDYVMALSLAEEDSRKGESKAREANKQQLTRAQLKEDEQLAWAIQESLYIHSPPPYDQGNAIQISPLPSTSSDRFCKGCKNQIGQEGQSLRCMGGVWHRDCLKCQACNLLITDKVSMSSEDRLFHESCYKEHHHPKCDVCKNFLPRSTGAAEYRAHHFWMQKYCPSHEQDNTPRCCSCERMEPRDMQYMILDDGRRLCLECLSSAIMDSEESKPLYDEIREFYKDLDMEVKQHIPLLLVERQALNKAMEGEKNGHHHLPETRGICLSEERIVPTIAKNQRFRISSGIIEMMTEPQKLVRSCDVTAILILYGFPRLLTGSILAHEMMHAWLRLAGYSKLSPEVEEGICQVMAHTWLEGKIDPCGLGNEHVASSSCAQPSLEKQLGEFFKHRIEEDTSPVYGEGFRVGRRAVQNFGLNGTLNHIRMTGSFPL